MRASLPGLRKCAFVLRGDDSRATIPARSSCRTKAGRRRRCISRTDVKRRLSGLSRSLGLGFRVWDGEVEAGTRWPRTWILVCGETFRRSSCSWCSLAWVERTSAGCASCRRNGSGTSISCEPSSIGTPISGALSPRSFCGWCSLAFVSPTSVACESSPRNGSATSIP